MKSTKTNIGDRLTVSIVFASTVWDHDFDEGFWFITSVATYEDWPIETVLVANLTKKNYVPKIQELAKQINSGWLPSEGTSDIY